MAISFAAKIVLAKIETTYGTDPTPTAAANALLAIGVKLMPMEGQDVDRELDLPYLAAGGTIVAGLHAKLSYKVEAQASGTAGTAPAWGPMMRACGCAQTVVASTSVTYNPITDNQESITHYIWLGLTCYKLKGGRGSCKLTFDKQAIPYLEFEFTGLFEVASEVARATGMVYTGFKKPKVAAKANSPVFTIGGTALNLKSLAFDLGNAVEPRLLITSEEILITDRAEKLDVTVEAVPLTTINPYQLAVDGTTPAVVFQHGAAAGSRLTLNVPLGQMQRSTSIESSQNVVEWPLSLVPQPNTGNDQFTLVLT